MKRGLKRTLVGVMSAAVIAGIVPVNALAVTNSDREVHQFYGRQVTVALSIQEDRASASTSAATADSVEATVTLAYTYNGETKYAFDSSYSNYNAVTATAVAEEYRPSSKYADATHIANFYIDGRTEIFDHYWTIR